MRLSVLLPALAGAIALGSAASAGAPHGPQAAPPPAHAAPVDRHPHHRWQGCPPRRIAFAHHHWRHHARYALAAPRYAPPPPPPAMMRPMPMTPMPPPPMAMARPHCLPCREHHLYVAGDHVWRDGSYGEVYPVSGRDAFGYLIWPGKIAQGDLAP